MLFLLWVNLPGHRLILCFMYCINVKLFQAYWALSTSNAYCFCIFPWPCWCPLFSVYSSSKCNLYVVLICIHKRVSGIALTLCVYCPFIHFFENFQVKYFVPIKLHHLPLSPGCVRSCILHSLLRVQNSFISCYPLSFPLKKKHTVTNGNEFIWLTCLSSKSLILVSFFLKLCNPKLHLFYTYSILGFSVLYLIFRMTIHLE